LLTDVEAGTGKIDKDTTRERVTFELTTESQGDVEWFGEGREHRRCYKKGGSRALKGKGGGRE